MKDNKLWTNNNSESMNNILQLETEWKSQNLTDLVSSLEKIVRAQFKEIMRAIPGIGNYKIAPLFKKYRTDYHAWVEMSQEDRRMLFMKRTEPKICNVHGWKTYITNNTIRWGKTWTEKNKNKC
jgi:hypothetical protein